MIEFDKMKEAKVGEKMKSRIVEIKEGKAGELFGQNYFANSKDKTPEQIAKAKEGPAVSVLTENGAELVMSIPSNGIINPKSTLAKFKRTYNAYPKVGLEVETKVADNGWLKVVLEA